jgi:hypothetical protein
MKSIIKPTRERGRPRKYPRADPGRAYTLNLRESVQRRLLELSDHCEITSREYAQLLIDQVLDLDDSFAVPILLGLTEEDVDMLPDYALAWAGEEPEERRFDTHGQRLQAYLRSLIAADITKRNIV